MRRTPLTLLAQSGVTIGSILLAMAVVALLETVIPFIRANEPAGPISAPTCVVPLMVLSRFGIGLLNAHPQPPVLELAVRGSTA